MPIVRSLTHRTRRAVKAAAIDVRRVGRRMVVIDTVWKFSGCAKVSVCCIEARCRDELPVFDRTVHRVSVEKHANQHSARVARYPCRLDVIVIHPCHLRMSVVLVEGVDLVRQRLIVRSVLIEKRHSVYCDAYWSKRRGRWSCERTRSYRNSERQILRAYGVRIDSEIWIRSVV